MTKNADKKAKASEQSEQVTAAILVIGDEILSGRTKDKNVGYMAEHFTTIGIDLREVRVIADVQTDIVEAVNALRARYTYVFTTGGIGPTHDDITADAIAKAFGIPIDFDDRALAILNDYYEKGEFTDARKKMARIPQGAELIENTVSRAPGFWIENVLVMAGVPGIMQCMLDAVTPKLKKGKRLLTATIHLDHPESVVAEILEGHQKKFPEISMGSYPFYKKGDFGTHLVLRSTDEKLLKEAAQALREHLTELGLDDAHNPDNFSFS